MRYVSKIYILDWLDEIIVSGYVFDQDPLTNPEHEKWEFSAQIKGVGMDGEANWLLNSLYRALVAEQRPAREGPGGAVPMGGPHIISGPTVSGRYVVG